VQSHFEGLKQRISSPKWEEKREYHSEREMSQGEGATDNYCKVETNFEQIRHGLIQKVFESKTSSTRYGVSFTDPPIQTLFIIFLPYQMPCLLPAFCIKCLITFFLMNFLNRDLS